MKSLIKFITTIIAGICAFPYLLVAQDAGTYIDNLGVQDSSYMEQDLLADTASSGSGTTTIIVVIVLVVIAAVAFFMLKKKKK
ncbi:MAG: LPXTG cell wall anchor domain-containing protein [Mariniphaga sp.]|nr:LPXTG cell wall anchor domain-containing protein [Mariniphaga sp.]MDD4225401.1 LPXTG cell wall anchor domain-containing protein [Mariniphaga sp.]MDD4424316.1 LPXTG cell wall anchor domain-containing protein [Mariniphaga sp.]